MKTVIRSFTLILLVVFSLSSCEKNSADASKGKAKFSIGPIETLNQPKSEVSESELVSYHVMVSVEDNEGNPVLTDELIPVYAFGTGFVSEEVELDAGVYSLTKFLVINPAGEVIYATPVEGSPMAYLVDDPLPIIFSVTANTSVVIYPEVLPAEGQEPGDFGYVSFGVNIIYPLDFYVVCYIDNPYMNCANCPMVPVEADLTVFAGQSWHYTFNLKAAVNKVIVRGGYPWYSLVLKKEGYLPQTFYVREAELKATTRENPMVLMIPWDSNNWKKLVLQPGPEDGKDAMVSNLAPDMNFGSHRYFEATFLTEPVLTVMRSNRSLIWFDLGALPKSAVIKKVTLTLWYDIPIPWDSAVFYPSTSEFRWCGAVLQQIVEPWEEMKVSWKTQPRTIEANQVYIYPFIKNANFIDVDVTSLYQPVDYSDCPNHGMLFRLWPEERFPGFRFASSDYHVATMRPQLTVYYTIPSIIPL